VLGGPVYVTMGRMNGNEPWIPGYDIVEVTTNLFPELRLLGSKQAFRTMLMSPLPSNMFQEDKKPVV
jgi:hypothetical protein